MHTSWPLPSRDSARAASRASAPVRKFIRYDPRFRKATWNRLYAFHGPGARHEYRVSQRDVRRSCHRIDYSLRAAAVTARHLAPAIVTIIIKFWPNVVHLGLLENYISVQIFVLEFKIFVVHHTIVEIST
jgi:hypothetical protein